MLVLTFITVLALTHLVGALTAMKGFKEGQSHQAQPIAPAVQGAKEGK